MQNKLLAQNIQQVCVDGDPTKCAASIGGVENLFSRVVSYALAFGGIVFLIMLLVGGFNLITAGSEAPKAESAKKNNYLRHNGICFCCSLLFNPNPHQVIYRSRRYPI